MRIRMITLAASPERIMRPGQVVEVERETALAMIAGGFADAAPAEGMGEAPAARRSVAMTVSPERRGAVSAGDVALITVPGIGEARAQALIDHGIVTAGELASAESASAEAIAAAIPGVGVATATRWIEAARVLVAVEEG